MATLGTAYVQIVPSAQGISGSISNLLGDEAASAGTSVGGKIGAFAKRALAKAAIGAAFVATVKGAMSEGAKLEQSYLGGLDTLYGDAAEAARGYAREAAKFGVSMNDYSEQAVSFGAALKAAYGGDTSKALEAANKAIQDMADNSAKMGTDMGSVQQAYQGFAKGQYQLLDNLKLGYGGTKTEMQRLLSDAQKLTGVEYNIDNLGDVYEAIHVIQGELGLTGVAAEEASQTLSGSFGAMKAAFQNLLGSLALGQGVQGAMSNLLKTANTFFFKNFLPMVGRIAKSIPGAIGVFLQQGLPMLVSSISTLLTNLSASVTTFANNITGTKVKAWLTATLPKILQAGAQIVGKLASAFISNLPKIVSAIGRIGTAIVTGLGSAIWGKVTQAANGIKDRFLAPIKSLKEKLDNLVGKIKKLFPVNFGKILHFSLPKISVSGGKAPWGIGGKGTKPSFSVDWEPHAAGGIFSRRTLLTDGSTIHEFNEAGREAIVPLDPFWAKMDQIVDAVQGGSSQTVINVYGSPGMDVTELANEVLKVIVNKERGRRVAWQ